MKQAPVPANDENTVPITIGLLAHVDAGKTSLAEAMLFSAGKLRKMGRVDHRDAFLDTYDIEKRRGITIFSKQAQLPLDPHRITLLDTPGHVDFSPETERTLQVLDYAILIVSGADGVQSHVQTLWDLLKLHQIPVFLFINKMDQPGCDRQALLADLKEKLSDSCMDFSVRDHVFYDQLATCSEEALEQYLASGLVDDDTIGSMIACRQVFPCFFGSARKLQGVEEFLSGLRAYIRPPKYPKQFGARVFKIARDEHGERLTWLKVTGGCLKVKSMISIHAAFAHPSDSSDAGSSMPAAAADALDPDDRFDSAAVFHEKVNQIRIYDGAGYTLAEEACAGQICAVAGLSHTRCGDGIGFEPVYTDVQLVPVLSYQVLLPADCDVHQALFQLRMLEEEEPQLHVSWNESSGAIHVQVMGEVQIEILRTLIQERFGLRVEFGSGSIIYKETIAGPVEGIGHFEPLRHYAEVHLLMEPLPRGCGMAFDADCREDALDLNWQRLILTHLSEKEHRGVLTGSALTDMKITLKAGRAHPKHTEGGDFRQATYRAVRQGLMKAQSVLLEPYYTFRLEVPPETSGRAMTDIQRMSGQFEPPLSNGGMTILTGRAPVSEMQDYPSQIVSYTHGRGRIFLRMSGYDICHNAEEIIGRCGYDADADTLNPSSSVFCSHGSGSVIPWNEVPAYMHLPSIMEKDAGKEIPEGADLRNAAAGRTDAYGAADRELQAIFERTYGSGTFSRSHAQTAYTAAHMRNADDGHPRAQTAPSGSRKRTPPRTGSRPDGAAEQYLLVDGYNIIFAWEDLNDLAKESAEAARGRLMDILCNYQGYRGMTLIVVFDAYKVEGNPGSSFRYHNIHVVYTKEAETADQYIEKTVHRIGRRYDVTVATSDRLEQVIILGQGARRMSARELRTEIEEMAEEIRSEHLEKAPHGSRYLFDELTPETARRLEEIRLGKKSL